MPTLNNGVRALCAFLLGGEQYCRLKIVNHGLRTTRSCLAYNSCMLCVHVHIFAHFAQSHSIEKHPAVEHSSDVIEEVPCSCAHFFIILFSLSPGHASLLRMVLLASAVFLVVLFCIGPVSPRLRHLLLLFCAFVFSPTVSTQTTVFFLAVLFSCPLCLRVAGTARCVCRRGWYCVPVSPFHPGSKKKEEKKTCRSPSSCHTSGLHLFLPAVFRTGTLPAVCGSALL